MWGGKKEAKWVYIDTKMWFFKLKLKLKVTGMGGVN